MIAKTRSIISALSALIVSSALPAQPAVENAPADPTLAVMKAELDRSLPRLKTAGAAPVYFLGYRLYQSTWSSISAENGALRGRYPEQAWAMLAVDLRVGDPHFDNTHRMRGRAWDRRAAVFESTSSGALVPIEPSSTALQQLLWLKTDEAFKEAQKRYSELKGNNAVLAEEEDSADDFSLEEPHKDLEIAPLPHVSTSEWENRVRELSQEFTKYPYIRDSSVNFMAAPVQRYIVTSEGSEIASVLPYYSANMSISSLTNDGMDLWLYQSASARKPNELPDDKKLTAMATELAKEMDQLRQAPPADPYVGPAILSGRASAVLFHEILGHRIEGLRQKDESDARTFSNRIGTKIMPSFLSVVDDPTIKELHGRELAGYYAYDDEGTPAQRVEIVNHGVLTGFLLSRSPLKGFPHSNGHGRGSPGWNPVARQGNLIIEADPSKQLSEAKLRAMLIKEVKRQHKPYGLYFTELSGGETYTSAARPQSISLYPLLVYRIYADGRPDELIRGVDLVGTPLSLLERIVAAGTDIDTFNGRCGAESGEVPVSATAPSLLIQSIEVQRKAKGLKKSPILPAPDSPVGEKAK
ncbi:MAG TPA: metallopeptidase TldD-related protein [Planktothrix sp.]